MSALEQFNDAFGFAFVEPVTFYVRRTMIDYAILRGRTDIAGRVAAEIKTEPGALGRELKDKVTTRVDAERKRQSL